MYETGSNREERKENTSHDRQRNSSRDSNSGQRCPQGYCSDTSYEENIIKKSLHWARRSVCDVCILSCSNLFFLSIKIHISEFTKHRRDFLAWACDSVLQHLCVNESEWSTKSSLTATLLLQITKTGYYSTRPLLNLELFFCLRVWFNKVKVLLGCTMFSWTERLLMWCMCRR